MASSPEVAHHNYPEVVRTQADPQVLSDPRYSYATNGVKDYSHHGEDARHTHAKPTQATVLGIRRRNFWILLVLAIVLVGATIGGSVGGSLAVKKDNGKGTSSSESPSTSPPTPSVTTTPPVTSTPSQSVTPPSTTYVAPPFSELRFINGTCPSSIIQPSIEAPDINNSNFNYDCLNGINIYTLPDLMTFTVYTLRQCVDACSQYNNLFKNNTCVGVTLDANVARSSTTGNGANCWLKGSTDKRETKQWSTSVVLRS